MFFNIVLRLCTDGLSFWWPLYFLISILSPLALLTFFVCFFVLFHSCCSHAQVFGITPVHEFLYSCSHTEWYFLFFLWRKRKLSCATAIIIDIAPEVAVKKHLIKKIVSPDRQCIAYRCRLGLLKFLKQTTNLYGYAFVLPVIEYCSPVWGSAAECHLQLLERQVYWVARLCSDQTFLSLCYRRHVAALCMLHKINSNSNHCLFSELPSASFRVRLPWTAAAAHPLEFELSMCRTSQFSWYFLPAQTRER